MEKQIKNGAPELFFNRTDSGEVVIAGFATKCVSSNVRCANIVWESTELGYGVGKEGDVVLVEVVSDIGSRQYLENQLGVNRRLYKGDRFVGVLANRHSGTEESGDVPPEGINIQVGTELHLLSTSGLVGISTNIPATMGQKPLQLKVLGIVAQDGLPLDLLDLCGPQDDVVNPSAPIIVVGGTSSDVGKTTTSAGLIRVLSQKGLRVAATKISGTGNLQDVFLLHDAGAKIWFEFPDVGLPSTYTSPARFRKGIYTLLNRINAQKPDVIIAEAGGDIIEANIPTFLSDPAIAKYIKAIMMVPGDVLGMIGSINYAQKLIPDVPIFFTDPKEKNAFTTRIRVGQVLPGFDLFNSLDLEEVEQVLRKILPDLAYGQKDSEKK
ncbi:MAG: hypothetical protein A2261_01745 [Candidatus Magasanikbacteria bacterium RIFOXYA2_FULL_44_8]|uniref:CobQ/CobB/MinD/ParA nucleotide binding domain-containing protein n=1 Tax=Candidatus Magasanikbacteria bacterium RIFOXYA2_FULL_44_8 TaxID=1798696 RepID=A0A1F6NKV4_9BACT|nr:MAG: hypothetical protein A2261_01745 [Candidatus Magasanikbacteria bacterium RIFOXYA2_FULL_44_8]